MKYFFLMLVLPLLLLNCTSYEKENKHLKEEIRMLKEENNYLKAEIIGLKKEITQVSARVKEEKETMQKKLQEEREQVQKKLQDEREAMQKKLQEMSKKKPVVVRKDQKENVGKPVPRTAPETKSPQAQPTPQ